MKTIQSHISNISKAILLGDFNTPSLIVDANYHFLANKYQDAWIASGEIYNTGRTWSIQGPVLRVDYIWVRNDFTINTNSASRFGTKNTSDHYGLVVEVT